MPALADLGISHLYASPLLTATPGSTHGYDVTDPTTVDAERGGEQGLRRLADTLHAHGMGLVLDIVPNHVGVAEPHLMRWWWDLLTYGRDSAFGDWFDVDWDSGRLTLPVLGSAGDLDALTLADGADGPELRYYDHSFPVAPGTDSGTPQEVHSRQHYQLVDWRLGNSTLNYRRFFDVTTLAGLRVEVPAAFDASHALVLQLVADGVVDGLRIDHPDGLADPAGYLERLSAGSGGAWTVVEKILEPGELLPTSWPVAGTTGYDAARLVTGVFVDPAGAEPLGELWQQLTGLQPAFAPLVLQGKREAATGLLAAEIARLGRIVGADAAPEVEEALAELSAQFPVYRSYLPASGLEQLEAAAAGLRRDRPDLEPALSVLLPRLSNGSDPLCVRFQQTSGMVMAKGVEDTAFYRHHVLLALNEVGGDPARFGVGVEEWHEQAGHLETHWPATMTLLSSHDTKRSEDVRARLVLLSEIPRRWAAVVSELAAAAAPHLGRVAPDDAYLLHQTLVGTGPIEAERIGDYLRKATREAKVHTTWTEPDEAYDEDLQRLVRGVLADPAYLAVLEQIGKELDEPWRRTVLAQKLLQLTMPGIPDLYQGSERTMIALVDPDNRRPVDFAAPEETKTELVRRVLTLRRDRPELFSGYEPVPVATPFAVIFQRSPDLLVVVARLAVGLARDGWGPETVPLPPGRWRDVLTGRLVDGPALAVVVGDGPGAVLVRELAP